MPVEIGGVQGDEMETLFGSADALRTEAGVRERVLAETRRTYSQLVDDSLLEDWVTKAVDELWSESIKVRIFVPVLALRRIREAIESRESTGIGRFPAA